MKFIKVLNDKNIAFQIKSDAFLNEKNEIVQKEKLENPKKVKK